MAKVLHMDIKINGKTLEEIWNDLPEILRKTTIKPERMEDCWICNLKPVTYYGVPLMSYGKSWVLVNRYVYSTVFNKKGSLHWIKYANSGRGKRKSYIYHKCRNKKCINPLHLYKTFKRIKYSKKKLNEVERRFLLGIYDDIILKDSL